MTKKAYNYFDEEIRLRYRKGVFFLRTKREKGGGMLVYTIRTARYGKGKVVARVQGKFLAMDGGEAESKLLARLFKKVKFDFVQLVMPDVVGNSGRMK